MEVKLECIVCGARSRPVSGWPLSGRDEQMLAEFRAEHDATCAAAGGTIHPAPPDELLRAAQVGPFGRDKPPPVSVLSPHGHFEYTGPYGEIQEGDTLSCCHCTRHWEVRLGSGRLRGWCSKCQAHTCGSPLCDVCIPRDQRLDNILAGKPELAPRPAMALVGGDVPAESVEATDAD